MTEKKKRILRIVFQSVITGTFVLFGLIYLSSISPMPEPYMFTNKFTSMLFALFISYVGLIYILVRFCTKNVKKWEIILYNILNLVFITVLLILFYRFIQIIPKINRFRLIILRFSDFFYFHFR